TMPDASPYFNKASIESGPGVRMMTKENAVETTAILLKELNISTSDWRKLLSISAGDLLTLQNKFSPVPPFIEENPNRKLTGFGPVVDGVALPHHPFDPTAPAISKNKPLLVGWNEDEYNFFAWQSKDTETFKLDFDGIEKKLEPRYGENTKRIIDVYRKSRSKASAPDIFVAISS